MQQVKAHTNMIATVSLFISASLKGFSQVLLVGNAVSGCLILIGLSLHSPILGLIAFASSLVGTITGKVFGGDHAMIHNGIYGFNSVLCGISAFLFLHGDKYWFIALFAASLASYLMTRLSKFFTARGIPVLTIPFLIVTWSGLLIMYRLRSFYTNPDFITSSPAEWNLPIESKPTLFIGLIKGIGEVFLIDSLWAGSLILVALFCAGWRFGLYALIGTFVSWLTAYFIGVDTQALNLGLYNYNAVLTILAVSLVFDEKPKKNPLTGIVAAILTVPVTVGLEMILVPLGLPVLTLSFILCTWLVIAARKIFPNI